MPELHFSQRESNSILLQSSKGGKADDTKLFWTRWWTKQEPKRQLWCGYPGWIRSKESGWEAELLVEGFVMNSSYSTYSYDPITSITRLESLVRAHIHVHMVKVSPTFIKRWEGARHREGLSVSTCSQGSSIYWCFCNWQRPNKLRLVMARMQLLFANCFSGTTKTSSPPYRNKK